MKGRRIVVVDNIDRNWADWAYKALKHAQFEVELVRQPTQNQLEQADLIIVPSLSRSTYEQVPAEFRSKSAVVVEIVNKPNLAHARNLGFKEAWQKTHDSMNLIRLVRS